MESIKCTFELIDGTSQGLSWGDVAVIVAAIVSVIGVLINLFFTNKVNKTINKNNNELQEKLNQKNIDANLKAKARIEWIQNVRNTSAELISLYYQLLNSTDKDILFETFIESQKKAELLILFFGPETQKQSQKKVSSTCIEDLEINEGKNDMIVEFLSDLNKDFYLYYSKALKNEKSTLEKVRKESVLKMFENPIDYVENGTSYDHEGNEISDIEPIWDPELEYKLDKIEKQIEENTRFTNNLNKKLIQLRNIMRIYLKIEWNKAKNGD